MENLPLIGETISASHNNEYRRAFISQQVTRENVRITAKMKREVQLAHRHRCLEVQAQMQLSMEKENPTKIQPLSIITVTSAQQ